MTRTPFPGWTRALWTALFCAFVSCTGCRCAAPALATLDQVRGEVLRDFAAAVNVWSSAVIGATFDFGDAIQTTDTATAVVSFDDGARLDLEPNTTVRFVRELSNGAHAAVQVETGSVVLTTTQHAINLETELGPALVEPGAVVRAALKRSALQLFVEVGVAQLDPTGPNHRELTAGQTIEIAIGAAVIETAAPAVASVVSPSVIAPSPAPVSSAPDGDGLGLTVTATVEAGVVSLSYHGKTVALPRGAHTVEPGATLRLKRAAVVHLTRGDSEFTLTGPTVYVVGDGAGLANMEQGRVAMRMGRDAGVVDVPGGWLRATGAGPTRVDIERRGSVTEVFIRSGNLQIKQGTETVTIEAGEGAHLDGKTTVVLGRGIGYRDLSVPVGGNFVFHNAEPPTAVGFNFPDKCRHLGVLEIVESNVVKAWASGAQTVSLALPTGVTAYRLRCLEEDGTMSEPITAGRVTGYADSGATQLPGSAASNVVNADGRTYTLLYQNRLPSVTVEWPNAPSAESYTLTHTSEGGTRSLQLGAPAHNFPSGALAEGRHTFMFRSALGRASRQATVTIQFDNAAPKASISAPANGSFAPNSEVEVKGIALPGWDVFAQGQALSTDAQGRFSGRVTANERGVLFTFSSPKRGAHYYLRRAKGDGR